MSEHFCRSIFAMKPTAPKCFFRCGSESGPTFASLERQLVILDSLDYSLASLISASRYHSHSAPSYDALELEDATAL